MIMKEDPTGACAGTSKKSRPCGRVQWFCSGGCAVGLSAQGAQGQAGEKAGHLRLITKRASLPLGSENLVGPPIGSAIYEYLVAR